MAKFEALNYFRFRVSYPQKLFGCLRTYLAPFIFGNKSLQVLDLGSGTGFSARSFFDFYPNSNFTLVDPDRAMLDVAEQLLKGSGHFVTLNARAESFLFEKPVDLVLIGSAWHWMDRSRLVNKFESADVGGIFIFEYQFPKAKNHPELNEWVRRAFNLKWKTSDQEPRGNLTELTQGLRDSFWFSEHSRVSFSQEEAFDLEGYWGMIISQSRFLAFEQTLPPEAREAERISLLRELSAVWKPNEEIRFLLLYEGFFFSVEKSKFVGISDKFFTSVKKNAEKPPYVNKKRLVRDNDKIYAKNMIVIIWLPMVDNFEKSGDEKRPYRTLI